MCEGMLVGAGGATMVGFLPTRTAPATLLLLLHAFPPNSEPSVDRASGLSVCERRGT